MSVAVEVGKQRIPGVYFLDAPRSLNDRLPVATGLLDRAPRVLSEVTHVCTDDRKGTHGGAAHIRDALIAGINAATRKVLFCSFLFADELIVQSLCAAAERLRGGVYIVTALEGDMVADTSDLGEDERSGDKLRERRARHDEHLLRLARAGAWLHSVPDCHAKFAVVDDRVVVVTSANATRDAYERNPENGLVIDEPAVARELGRLFAHLWLERASLESVPGADLDLGTAHRKSGRPWKALRADGDLRPVCTLDGSERSLLAATLDLLDRAERELVVASYSAVALEGHPVGLALRKALERGVKLTLLLRPRNAHELQRRTCEWLFDGASADQFCLVGHDLTHAKAIVADGRRALVWTGNLDGERGYEKGIEVGIATEREELTSTIRDYVLCVAQVATRVGVVRPTLDEVARTAREEPLTGEWTLRIPANFGIAEALPGKLAAEPVGYLRLSEGFALRVGTLVLGVEKDDASHSLTVQRVHEARGLVGRPFDGYVTRCTMRVDIVQPPVSPRGSPPHRVETRHRRPRPR